MLQSPETVALTTAPPALTVKIVSLVCHVCLVLFELLPFSWSLEWGTLCAGLLRTARLSVPQPFVRLCTQSPWFSQMLWGLFFSSLVCWAGEPIVCLGPWAPHRGPPQPKQPSSFLILARRGCGARLLHVTALSTCLVWLLYILRYGNSDQLVLGWFSMTIVL